MLKIEANFSMVPHAFFCNIAGLPTAYETLITT